jgi:hypothetical protein
MSISFVIGLFYLKEYNDTAFNKRPPSEILKRVRRMLGIVRILLAIAAVYFGVFELGLPKIISGKQDDLIFGIIMTMIIAPITVIGLFLLGRYSLQGEYYEQNLRKYSIQTERRQLTLGFPKMRA